MSQDLAKLPLKINNDPQFDSKYSPALLDFLAPGVWIILLFFLGDVLSGDFFIEEILVSNHLSMNNLMHFGPLLTLHLKEKNLSI